MKTLVLASLIAAAATGCVSDDDGGGGVAAHVGATWSINSLASNSAIPCPPGFDTAVLHNQPVDSNGNPVGSDIEDVFDCAAGQGTSAALPATTYETWIEITPHDINATPYAQSTPAFLDVTDVDLTYNAKIYDDAGYFALQWDLVGASSNAPLTCAQAGVTGATDGVELIATLSSGGNLRDEQFTCDDHQGVTDPLAAGVYTLSVDAFTNNGSIGTAPAIPDGTIQTPNKITDLGTVTIPIDGM